MPERISCPTCTQQPRHFIGHKNGEEVHFIMCIECRPLFGPCTVAGVGDSLGEAIESWNKSVDPHSTSRGQTFGSPR